ncbi:uncharacterized protein EV420DRAFT_1710145 [Desarmillaria tabescens]|uniref:Fungal-type protein kinase domain-containing protein n=1 Tax=Armillaria tabescens TaxID=1929756 RepID=A0AA39NIE3_ARMTA|nr:uncharacterized protein EV420DRAFT_1710145 [Desarmillaria tabescens]KAK0466194.1 hypothetical protein EV420DRAFT_1710145 [Desarmillaria tabescens]
MTAHWIGPMPVELFLHELMGTSGNQFTLISPGNFHHIFESIELPAKYVNEKEYAIAVQSMIQDVASELIPGLKFVQDDEFKDANSAANTVPDTFVYASDVNTTTSTTRWNKAELWLEFKRAFSFHSFKDGNPHDWVSQRLSAKNYRDGVPFFKWERTYTIVSRAFNLSTEGKYLVEFLYRFSALTDRDRGKDDAVTPATDEEISLVGPLSKPWISGKYPHAFVKIRVPNGDGETEVLAGPMIATPQSVLGRATFVLSVYNGNTDSLRFLKKNWQDADLPQESVILKALNVAGVCSVPTFICGSIVSGQKIASRKYIDKDWNLGTHPPLTCIREHRQVRLIEVGQPLNKFKSSEQLTRVVYEAFLAHEAAFTTCNILHRDISCGNILIAYDDKAPKDNYDGGGRGLLNDWDIAMHTDNLEKVTRGCERMGTWQFMSIGLLRDRTKEHEPRDDFESFVYVMLYHGLCYLRHSKVGPGLQNMIARIFADNVDNGNGTWSGGDTKTTLTQRDRGRLGSNFRFDCRPLNSWIRKALMAIGEWRNFSPSEPQSDSDKPGSDVLPAIDPQTSLFHDHTGQNSLWKSVLRMDGWPSNDQAKYQLEPTGTKQTREDDTQPTQKRQKSTHSVNPV